MQEKDAPTNVSVTAVDKCLLTFEHESFERKWYLYGYRKTNEMPAEL